MKNSLIAILLLVAASAWGQTTFNVTANPETITITDTNTNNLVFIVDGAPVRVLDVWVRFPSSNVGTVQLNTESSTMTTATVLSATTHPQGVWLEVRGSLSVKVTNANDKVDIVFYKKR